MKIGVDAGGTKTELILIDDEGVVIARHTGPGCNPSVVGPDKARGILLQALEELLSPAKALRDPSGGIHPNRVFSISATHIYAAGNSAFWKETASALVHFGDVTTGADSIPVLELATNGEPGLVLHAGTGSFIAARDGEGAVHYAGGLGWRFGDPGSATDIGRRAIARGLLELQGWMQRTGLGDAVCSYTRLEDYASVSRFFYESADANAKIAPFAAVVVELAMRGNRPAQLSIVESLTELVDQARLVTEKLFSGKVVPCGVSGSLLNTQPAVHAMNSFVASHQWPVKLHFITEPPIEGVHRLLLK